MAFGPAFIIVDLLTQSPKTFFTVNSILMVFIVLTFVSNTISVRMLTTIQNHRQLGCYQEVAYWISKGNRGYIFLISILKLIYLITTCAYCFQYIANYMTSLTVIFMGANTLEAISAWTIWGVYLAWLSLIAGSMFYLYFTNKCYASLLPYARLMFYSVVASLGLLICFLVILTSVSFR